MSSAFSTSASQWPISWLVPVLHMVCFLLVCYHCLRNRREATTTLLWVFVAWCVPLLGPFFYLYFGIDRVPDKGFKKHITDQRLLAERKAREDEALPLAYWRSVHDAVADEPSDAFAKEFNSTMDSFLPEHPLLGGNEIDPLVTGDETFPRMIESIAKARHHVHVQTFIIGNDVQGRRFLDLLKQKAAEGVLVRVMFDRFGSTHAVLGRLFRPYRDIPRMQVAGWTQANPLKRQFQINLRNHRKILVVDGREAFCGGINIHAEHSTCNGRPPIQDYHFHLRGPAVQELQYTFMRDWFFMTEEDPEALLQEVYFPHLHAAGAAMVRVVNSGPTFTESEAIAETFFAAIVSARKQILAVTPYFVPPRDMVRALRTAAFRGVDVRLVVPKENNHRYAGLAGRALYDELLDAGVRVFERRPPFMHAKAFIVDDAFAVVGTSNLDARSLRLNYEVDLVVYDNVFLNRLKEIVLADFARSDEIELISWRARPPRQRIIENLCFLMMPVL